MKKKNQFSQKFAANITTNTVAKLLTIGLITVGFFSAGCGSKKTINGQDVSDDSYIEEASRVETGGSKKLALCNRVSSDFIEADLKTLYSNGEASFEFIYLKINSLTSKFHSLEPIHIRFFAWEATSNSEITLDEEPLNFRIERKSVGQAEVMTGYYDTLSAATLSEIIKEYNDENPSNQIKGKSVDEWLKEIHFVVSGLSRYDDAIKIAGYTGDGAATYTEDMLIPAFYSDPNTYATALDPDGNSRPSVLTKLHPFNEYKKSWSGDDGERFYNEAKEYCFDTYRNY